MNEIVSRAIALGMAIQQKIHSPSDDCISLSQAARYLLSLGYKNPKKVLKLYAEQGKIHIHKPQGADNKKASCRFIEQESTIFVGYSTRNVGRIGF